MSNIELVKDDVAYVNGKAYKLVPIPTEKIFIGEVDGKKYYLGPEADRQMNWEQAKKWVASAGGQLMPREVGVLAFKKAEIRKQFRTDDWYWLEDEYSSSHGWIQYFYNGSQGYSTKPDAFYVRAVFVE
ncbi:MAG: hypothetical protein M0R77_07670 [Gammaproteobacteria bacterium]|nr:hypothetical protein [Gammaproteobacteria bacterium]